MRALTVVGARHQQTRLRHSHTFSCEHLILSMSFKDLGLSDSIIDAIQQLGYEKPTPNSGTSYTKCNRRS